MKKRLFAIMCVAALSISLLAGCGSKTTETPAEPAPTEETTDDTATDDAATEDTTASTDESEFYEDIPFIIINNTGFDVYELYVSDSNEDTWGENQIPEDKYMADGATVEMGTLSFYADDACWDIQFVEEDGTEHDFYDIDMNLSAKDEIVVSFSYDDVSGDYVFNIDSAE